MRAELAIFVCVFFFCEKSEMTFTEGALSSSDRIPIVDFSVLSESYSLDDFTEHLWRHGKKKLRDRI